MTTILGIDLAWGKRMPDAIARIDDSTVRECHYLHGDDELLEFITEVKTECDQLILALDAPTICLNETGSRPVDKECNRLFRRYEAGCHPVNLSLCERPLKVAGKLKALGFQMTCDLSAPHLAMEVYPHPAMIRWFGLEKTIKYKRGKVAEKREGFTCYQTHFREFLKDTTLSPDLNELLELPWSKKTEDLLDAWFCAFIGYWHVLHEGTRSQILGDSKTGQMLIPISV